MRDHLSESSDAPPVLVQGGEYLAFRLGNEEYGIDILKVQEIRGYENVTRIATSPDFIKGVVNLRGTIVPIVDMRIKFRLASAEYNAFTVVIVLNVAHRVVGLVVDAVSDVVRLSDEQVRAAPSFSSTADTHCITGLGVMDGRTIILMDIEELMSGSDMALVQSDTLQ